MQRTSYLRQLPKIQLHAHLGGSCPRPKLIELLSKYNYQQQIQFINNPKFGFGQWFQAQFYSSALVMKTKEGLIDYLSAVVQNFIDDNVVYLQLRTTPRAGDDYTIPQFFQTIIQAYMKYQDKIKVKIIVSLNRDAKNFEIYKQLIQMIQLVSDWKTHIVGLDVSGNPNSRPITQFIPIIQKGRQIGLKLTVHTAQVPTQAVETKQILNILPQRIGHFSSFCQQQLSFVIENNIVVEVCIWSGKTTKQKQSIMDLVHVKQFYDKRVKYCICTDDLLLFDKNVSDELENYLIIVGQNDKHVFNLMLRTVEYIFDPNQKQFILQKLDSFKQKCTQFANQH